MKTGHFIVAGLATALGFLGQQDSAAQATKVKSDSALTHLRNEVLDRGLAHFGKGPAAQTAQTDIADYYDAYRKNTRSARRITYRSAADTTRVDLSATPDQVEVKLSSTSDPGHVRKTVFNFAKGKQFFDSFSTIDQKRLNDSLTIERRADYCLKAMTPVEGNTRPGAIVTEQTADIVRISKNDQNWVAGRMDYDSPGRVSYRVTQAMVGQVDSVAYTLSSLTPHGFVTTPFLKDNTHTPSPVITPISDAYDDFTTSVQAMIGTAGYQTLERFIRPFNTLNLMR